MRPSFDILKWHTRFIFLQNYEVVFHFNFCMSNFPGYQHEEEPLEVSS